MCQYHVNLARRFAESSKLTIPETLTVIKAIGLWHVHGHKDECLFRFATTYIPGVGIVDGEILETLWSLLNRTSRSCRGSTVAHRTEVLDDHMGDSNWKKTINMSATILKKYHRAVREAAETSDYFAGLSESAPKHLVPEWKRQVAEAESERNDDVSVMDVYQARIPKPPGRQEIEVQLGQRELGNDASGVASWISQGLKIEEAQ